MHGHESSAAAAAAEAAASVSRSAGLSTVDWNALLPRLRHACAQRALAPLAQVLGELHRWLAQSTPLVGVQMDALLHQWGVAMAGVLHAAQLVEYGFSLFFRLLAEGPLAYRAPLLRLLCALLPHVDLSRPPFEGEEARQDRWFGAVAALLGDPQLGAYAAALLQQAVRQSAPAFTHVETSTLRAFPTAEQRRALVVPAFCGGGVGGSGDAAMALWLAVVSGRHVAQSHADSSDFLVSPRFYEAFGAGAVPPRGDFTLSVPEDDLLTDTLDYDWDLDQVSDSDTDGDQLTGEHDSRALAGSGGADAGGAGGGSGGAGGAGGGGGASSGRRAASQSKAASTAVSSSATSAGAAAGASSSVVGASRASAASRGQAPKVPARPVRPAVLSTGGARADPLREPDAEMELESEESDEEKHSPERAGGGGGGGPVVIVDHEDGIVKPPRRTRGGSSGGGGRLAGSISRVPSAVGSSGSSSPSGRSAQRGAAANRFGRGMAGGRGSVSRRGGDSRASAPGNANDPKFGGISNAFPAFSGFEEMLRSIEQGSGSGGAEKPHSSQASRQQGSDKEAVSDGDEPSESRGERTTASAELTAFTDDDELREYIERWRAYVRASDELEERLRALPKLRDGVTLSADEVRQLMLAYPYASQLLELLKDDYQMGHEEWQQAVSSDQVARQQLRKPVLYGTTLVHPIFRDPMPSEDDSMFGALLQQFGAIAATPGFLKQYLRTRQDLVEVFCANLENYIEEKTSVRRQAIDCEGNGELEVAMALSVAKSYDHMLQLCETNIQLQGTVNEILEGEQLVDVQRQLQTLEEDMDLNQDVIDALNEHALS